MRFCDVHIFRLKILQRWEQRRLASKFMFQIVYNFCFYQFLEFFLIGGFLKKEIVCGNPY